MKVKELIEELKKHSQESEVDIELRLSSNLSAPADFVAYEPSSGTVFISGGKS